MSEHQALTVELRPVEPGDLPVFFAHQRDTIAAEMAGFPARDHATFTRSWKRMLANDGVATSTILCDGSVAGHIACAIYSGRYEVSYWLGRAFWGRGVATRALASFLARVTVRPVYAHVAKHNIASARVLEKCGFQRLREQRNLIVMQLRPANCDLSTSI